MITRLFRHALPTREVPARQFPAQVRLPLPTPSFDPPAFLPGRLFSLEQRCQLRGRHERRIQLSAGCIYAAGVGMAEAPHDTVTVTVAEIDFATAPAGLRIVQHYRWTRPEHTAVWNLRSVVGQTWGCAAALIGSSTAGRTLSLRLDTNHGDAVLGEVRSPAILIAGLLQAVSSGRVHMYADDGSQESQDFWSQIIRARRRGQGEGVRAFVEPITGDDGYVASLALAVQAADSLWSLSTLQEA